MKKLIVSLSAYLILTVSFRPISSTEAATASANERAASETTDIDNTENVNIEARLESFISTLWQDIDFSACNELSLEAFNKAYRGYLNLRLAGKLSNDQILTVIDFSMPSTTERLWVINLATKKVLFNAHVAHGKGSGDLYATRFSNSMNSHMSSLGFYVTGDTYKGSHGNSLHLNGMDAGFNDQAYDRAVVLHGSKYVGDKYVLNNNSLGRSLGCPAVATALAQPIIKQVKDGTCIFMYFPDAKYLKSGYWLNKKVTHLPENLLNEITIGATPKPKVRVIEYVTNGKVDSVKTIQLTN